MSFAEGIFELIKAADTGNIQKLTRLLKEGVEPNQDYYRGYTPLHHAARENHLNCVKVLLQYGALINTADAWTIKTALHWAAQKGYKELLIFLLEHGADTAARCYLTIDSPKTYTPKEFAKHFENFELVQILENWEEERCTKKSKC